MKLTVVLMIFGMVQLSATSYSQNVKLNLKRGQNTLKHVFDQIEKQSTFTIFYQDEQVNLDKQLANTLQGGQLSEVLDKALEGTGLTYKINDQVIIILEEQPEMAYEQDVKRTVKGRVIGLNGESLPGVNVFIEGTTTGTITNIDGEYELAVEGNDQNIVFSFIGFETQTIAVSGRTQIDITLVEESIGLDEVVAVGYGVQKKSDLTGAVASVKSDDLTKVAAANPAEGLQGRIAGVNITKGSGAPGGSGVSIKIRGVGTLGGNTPLIVVDGFIGGNLNDINPNDIESMEVLKDGAAAAIYGSRAANGVILVTTKRGKKGEVKIDITSNVSVVNSVNNFDLLNSQEYINVHKMMYQNAGEDLPEYLTDGFAPKADTDWQDQVFRTGMLQNHNVRLSGGSENITYSLSGGMADEKGTLIGSDFRRNNWRARIGLTKGILDVDANLSYSGKNEDTPFYSMTETYKISPLIPVYDENAEWGYGMTYAGIPDHRNPIARQNYRQGGYEEEYVTANISGTLNLFEWLKYKVNGGYKTSSEYTTFHVVPHQDRQQDRVSYTSVEETRAKYTESLMENLLIFNKKINEHSFDAVLGYSYQEENYGWTGATALGYMNEHSVEGGSLVTVIKPAGFQDKNFSTINAGEGGEFAANGSNWTYTRISMFGRVNYSFASKYLVQFSVRRDGSSKFGSKNQYGTFPSAAIGWRLTEEGFLKDNGLISNLKLRASWGQLGSEGNLQPFMWQALISNSNAYDLGYVRGNGQSPWPGSAAREMANAGLKWEVAESLNMGLDYGFMNNRITGTINYYINDTKDLLMYFQPPLSSGFEAGIMNTAAMRNQGLELELTYHSPKRPFTYDITGTLSTLKNEVTALDNPDQSIYGSGLFLGDSHFPNQTRIGSPVGAFYLYQTDGLFQSQEEVDAHVNADGVPLQAAAAPGDVRFVDTNKDGSIGEDDKVYMGTGLPKVEYSLTFNASYKNFDFSMLWYGVAGNKIYNGIGYNLSNMSGGSNYLSSTLDAWTPDNTNTSVPRAVLGDPNGNAKVASDRYLEDGAYLKLKNLQIGYSLPQSILEKVSIDKLRIYVGAQNLLTLTDYSGLDPEISRDVFNSGTDRSVYPQTRMITTGVQLSF
ncbi:TonB-dependent receptor [Carboxylicivirga taeanensis]|uniref:TonB-dependent receptor n=1 Tax=Carboxylicivirga taeanensis TaxID=1416875 RepID=UPI003F6DE614